MRLSQAILPVAGLGTRFLPWTKVVPKEFLPIGSRPFIALLVEECLTAGIDDICFVISPGKELIPKYFEKNPTLEQELVSRGHAERLTELVRYDNVRFHTVYQHAQLGDGHAILQTGEWVDSDSVAILFGDDYFAHAATGLEQMLNAREHLGRERGSVLIALESIQREQTHQYGIVDVEHTHEQNPRLKRLKGLVEKPDPEDAPSTLGIVGRYLIPKSTFDVLATSAPGPAGEIRLIDALIKQLGSVPIYGYECEGIRVDTGTPEGYAEAVKVLSSGVQSHL